MGSRRGEQVVERAGLDGRQGDSGLSRLLLVGLAALVAVALQMGLASAAGASSFYWYGQNNSTCWQTGQLGSPSEACSSVTAGFLPTPGGNPGGLAHMRDITKGGVGEEFGMASGDYCDYYRMGGAVITAQDPTNEGTVTGITEPTPYQNYQESDAHHNACQANGSWWGQELRGPGGNGCPSSETCGMHHYVSLKSQGANDRPWSSSFGEPSLVLSAEAGVHTFSGVGSFGGWGYLCAELEDQAPGQGILEYCLQEWRGKNNGAVWKNEKMGECNSPWNMVNTYFWPGTSYATEMPGSTNTFEVGSPGGGHYEAKITEANLRSAIQLNNRAFVEEHPGVPTTGAGCGGHLTENPADYALIGVEQGIEGWGGLSVAGGYSGNLQARTDYTALRPTTTTSGASETQETSAKLNGYVNPNGSDTHYYFEYGPTASYGSTIPAAPGEDIGSGTGTTYTWNMISGLKPGTTYHYRVVAGNGVGTSYGQDMTLTTHQTLTAFEANTNNLFTYSSGSGTSTDTKQGMMAGASPSMALVPGQGYYTAFQANTGNLAIYSSATGVSTVTSYGVKSGTNPSITALANGSYEIAYVATSGNLSLYSPASKPMNTNTSLGMQGGSSPSIVALAGSGYEVAFEANTNNLFTYSSITGTATDTKQGMMGSTSPSISVTSSGAFNVAFQANISNLAIYSSATGVSTVTPSGMQAGTSPSIATLPAGGYEVAFKANTNNLFTYASASGSSTDTKQGMMAGTNPSIAVTPSGAFNVAFQANNSNLAVYSSATGVSLVSPSGMKAATSPSIVAN